MQRLTKGKYLWTRTVGSTVVGQFANTVLFYLIALYAILPSDILITSILSAWLLKVAVEVILTPLTYAVIRKVKKIEGEDYYDRGTDFNPLSVKVK